MNNWYEGVTLAIEMIFNMPACLSGRLSAGFGAVQGQGNRHTERCTIIFTKDHPSTGGTRVWNCYRIS